MIEARALHKTYRTGTVSLHVLKGVNLTVGAGEFVAMMGPSGAGKSTLLHLLAGLDVPTRGEVLWQGTSLSRMSDQDRAKLRNRAIGFVFQFYHLLPELSALENVMLPGLIHGHRPRGALRARARNCLEQVGLETREHHKPNQLSGGELQRVAIARALLNEPQVILCDEPTGNLDSETGQAIAQLLVDVQRRRGVALVLVTHEEALARLAHRRLMLCDGTFVSELHQRSSHQATRLPSAAPR